MGSKIRELNLGSYNKNVARIYNWRVTITKFPAKIREIIKNDYPNLYSQIGGDGATDPLLVPLDSFCTGISIPRTAPDPITVLSQGDGVEVAGVFTFYNFIAECIIDADFAFFNVFKIWAENANTINGLHNYTGNIIFEKTSNDLVNNRKKVVARYHAGLCWAKEVSVVQNDSSEALSNFTITFTSRTFTTEDVAL